MSRARHLIEQRLQETRVLPAVPATMRPECDRPMQEGTVRWNMPAEAQEAFRQAYLKLHTLKHDLDQMEEIPSFLQPLYSKVMELAEYAGEGVQKAENLKALVRKQSLMR